MDDRRLHPRRRVDARVRLYHTDYGIFEGMIHDVSPGGMRVLLEEVPPIVACNGDGRFQLEPRFMDVIFDMDCVRVTHDGIALVFSEEEGEAEIILQ